MNCSLSHVCSDIIYPTSVYIYCIVRAYSYTRYNNIFYYIEYCIEFGPLDWPQELHLKM